MFGNRKSAFKNTAPGLATEGNTNFENVKAMLDQEYKNPFQKWDAMGRLLGISMHQASALDQLPQGQYGQLGSMLERFNIKPESINASAFQGLADVAVADDQKLISLRDDVLKRDDLNKQQRQTLTAAKPGEDLRKSLATTLADVGREKTQGADVKQATVDVKNSVIETGQMLLTPINSIKDGVAMLVGGTNNVIESVKDALFAPRREIRKNRRLSRGGGGEASDGKTFFESFGDGLFPEKRNVPVRRARLRKPHENNPVAQEPSQAFTINPLEVIHRNEQGRVTQRQALPVAKIQKTVQ